MARGSRDEAAEARGRLAPKAGRFARGPRATSLDCVSGVWRSTNWFRLPPVTVPAPSPPLMHASRVTLLGSIRLPRYSTCAGMPRVLLKCSNTGMTCHKSDLLTPTWGSSGHAQSRRLRHVLTGPVCGPSRTSEFSITTSRASCPTARPSSYTYGSKRCARRTASCCAPSVRSAFSPVVPVTVASSRQHDAALGCFQAVRLYRSAAIRRTSAAAGALRNVSTNHTLFVGHPQCSRPHLHLCGHRFACWRSHRDHKRRGVRAAQAGWRPSRRSCITAGRRRSCASRTAPTSLLSRCGTPCHRLASHRSRDRRGRLSPPSSSRQRCRSPVVCNLTQRNRTVHTAAGTHVHARIQVTCATHVCRTLLLRSRC